MKRAVAVTGPTPPGIRWTLKRACPLRDPAAAPPAEATGRRLTGLAEWSRAIAEGRVHGGFCWHQDCSSLATPLADALVFPEAEPAEMWGGPEVVRRSCQGCEANCSRWPAGVAGCWGTLLFQNPESPSDLGPADLGLSDLGPAEQPFVSTTSEWRLGNGEVRQVPDRVGWWTEFFQRLDEAMRTGFESMFRTTRPGWYGLWLGSSWTAAQTAWLAEALVGTVDPVTDPDWEQLVRAIRAAHRHGLTLQFERFPGGQSVAGNWTTEAHCPECGWPRSSRRPCPCCGCTAAPDPGRRRKVLGLRPWLRLVRLMDEAKAEVLLAGYRSLRGKD